MRYHLELLSRPAGLPVHFLVQWLLLFKLAGLCSMTEKPCAFGEHTHTIKNEEKEKHSLTLAFHSAHVYAQTVLCVYYTQTGVHRLRAPPYVAATPPPPPPPQTSTRCKKIAH